MLCTVCRAPFLADPTSGSAEKLKVISALTGDDLAHLTSAVLVRASATNCVWDVFPVDEEEGIFIQGRENGVQIRLISHVFSPTQCNFAAHKKCMAMFHEVLGFDPRDERTYIEDMAILDARMCVGPQGEFLGMSSPFAIYTDCLRFGVSEKSRKMMRAVGWDTSLDELWKFRDPDHNVQNAERIRENTQLIQRVRVRAGPPSSHILIHFKEKRAKTKRIGVDRAEEPLDGPTFVTPLEAPAIPWMTGGGMEKTRAVWQPRFYPRTT